LKEKVSVDYFTIEKPPSAFYFVLLPKLAKSTLSGPIYVIQFPLTWCQFSKSVQIKLSYYRMPRFAIWYEV